MPLISDASWDPLTPAPTSYLELKARYQTLNDLYVQEGRIQPWVFPYRWIYIVLFLLYFISIPPSWLDAQVARSSPFLAWRRRIAIYAKYPLFALYTYTAIRTIAFCRTPSFAATYSFGLMNIFGVWSFGALFIFRDARFDGFRLERTEVSVSAAEGGNGYLPCENGTTSQAAKASGADPHENGEARARGIASQAANGRDGADADSPSASGPTTATRYTYHWQGLPSTLSHRVVWVLDLCTALRGAGWKHQVRTMASPPQHVQNQLPPDQRITAKPTCRVDYDRRSLLLHNLWIVVSACIIWDVLKAVMMTDPYFWGLVDAAPPGWLPPRIAQSPILVRAFRLCLSGAGVALLLRSLFSLSPLFFVGLLGPRRLGFRAEAWMYPDVFGDPRYVLEEGLTGLWGAWWQQIFRVTFTRVSDAVVTAFGWRARGLAARLVALAAAFSISGSLHFAGSYTMVGPTRSFMPFLFFVFQMVGVLLETAFGLACARSGISAAVPDGAKKLCRAVWVVIWIYITAPYFANDLARGGLWLVEPVPVSFVKLLGFGPEAGKWWNWNRSPVSWYTAERWWQSGITI